MADKESKFASMFAGAPAPTAPGSAERSAARIAPKAERPAAPMPKTERVAPPASRTERAPGKRSRADYKQFSVLLKRQTHKQAVRALDDLENGQDFSDLMEQLLGQWLKGLKHKPS